MVEVTNTGEVRDLRIYGISPGIGTTIICLSQGRLGGFSDFPTSEVVNDW